LPSGLGRPENASLAGLPVDYILRQLDDFRSGARRSSEPRSVPANLMVEAANAIDELVRQLYDLRAGKRHGALATLMQPVVTALDDADTVAVAAYLASVTP
jgi:cytochrome c553